MSPNAAASPDVLKSLFLLLVVLNPASHLGTHAAVTFSARDAALLRLQSGASRGSASDNGFNTQKEEFNCSTAPSDPALKWCQHARGLVLNNCMAEISMLYGTLEASALNPRDDFAESAGRIFEEGIRAYEQSAKAWEASPAYKCERNTLERALAAELLHLTRLQLSIVRGDAMDNFHAGLVMLMAESANYRRAARRLIKKVASKHEKSASANIPSVLTKYRDALLRRKVSGLHSAMVAMADLHEEEAVELPPREQDLGPAPWYKQVGAQLLSQLLMMSFNIGVAYLQHCWDTRQV